MKAPSVGVGVMLTGLALGHAGWAQGPATQALGGPAQARVAAPAPPQAVKPGDPDGADAARRAQLAAALAAGDLARAFDLGATPEDLYPFVASRYRLPETLGPFGAVFVNDTGRVAIGVAHEMMPNGRGIYSGPYIVPGVLIPPGVTLPTLSEAMGFFTSAPPAGAPSAAELAITAKAARTDANAQELFGDLLALRPELQAFDPSSAQLVWATGLGGGFDVALRATSSDGRSMTATFVPLPMPAR